MTRMQGTIVTGVLTVVTVMGALRMYAPQPYAWTVAWILCLRDRIHRVVHALRLIPRHGRPWQSQVTCRRG